MDKVTEMDLNSLRADLMVYKELIKETAGDIIKEGYSNYPIFVAHQFEAKIGEVILDRKELGINWTIHASTLDEFSQIGIVKKDRIEFFKETYKDPEKFICIFIITEKGGNFVFVPYESGTQMNLN